METGNNNEMSQQDMIQKFHRLEAHFFHRLVHDLGQDPTNMRWVMAFWLWLESVGHDNFVFRTYRMPGPVVLRIVEEAVACLRCLAGEAPDMDSLASSLRCTNAFLVCPVGDVGYFADDRRAKVLEGVNYFYKKVSLVACVGNNNSLAVQPRINLPDRRDATPTVMPSSPARRVTSSPSPARAVISSISRARAAPPPVGSSIYPARVAPQRMTPFPSHGGEPQMMLTPFPGRGAPHMMSLFPGHGEPQLVSLFPSHGGEPQMVTSFPVHGATQMVSAPVHAAPMMMTSSPAHAAPQMMMSSHVYAAPAPQMMTMPDPAALQMVSYAAAPPMMMVPPPAYSAPPTMMNSPDPAALHMMSSSYEVAAPMLNPMASPWAPMEVQSTMPEDYRSPLPEDYRSLFVTFSKGHPVNRDDIIEFFNSTFGPCVEAVLLEKVQPGEVPLYGRVVLRSAAMIPVVLGGQQNNKFVINGKHLWARVYVPNSRVAV